MKIVTNGKSVGGRNSMTVNSKVENSREKVRRLLRELFQFDAQDLDFGIYRILNFRRKEIERFIEDDLIKAVEAEFKEYAKAGMVELQKEVEKLRAEINHDFGEGTIDEQGHVKKHEDTPKVQDYVRKVDELKSAEASEAQMNEVFNHVYEFFSRYYDKGDFISKRRYGGREKYYVPYNGEEVVLHWANKDQYYVKTTEYFRNYSFKAGPYRVNFLLREVYEEVNNVVGENKYFVLCDSDAVKVDDEKKTVEIHFEYRALTDDEKKKFGTRNVQEGLVSATVDKIFSETSSSRVNSELRVKVDEEETSLEKHLTDYVRRNTTDYFIHKNLEAFLNRELEFYIKNEVVDMDGFENLDERSLRIARAKVKAIREISNKIIGFLAQIEDFEKMLFEKRKFVLKTGYCTTLDKVPQELYDEIGKNEKQVLEWKELFKLDEITKGTLDSSDATKGKTTLDADFLKKHKNLVLDTKFFSEDFKSRLLSTYDNLDDEVTGVVIRSDSFHALNLLQSKYREKVKCIYIDPPFNTGSTKILYKNEYEHSSWVCMVENRLLLGLKMLEPGGILEIAIDDYEGHRLRMLIDRILSEENRLGTITVVHNPGGRHDDKFIATAHEYMLVYSNQKEKAATYNLPLSEEDVATFRYNDEKGAYRLREFRRSGSHSTRFDRPNMWYPIYYNPKTKEIEVLKRKEGMVEILPIDPKGIERVWRWGKDTLQKKKDELIIEPSKDGYIVKVKARLEEKGGLKPKSVWNKSSYSSALGTTMLKDILGKEGMFSYPKSLELVIDALRVGADDDSTILDFFAGSGTTAHAVLKLNAQDKGNRKYILVEMEDYFETVLLPRIKKIMYSENWRNGLPTSSKGYSHILKYMYLEQYEDTLSNIVFLEKDKTMQETLDEFGDYLLRQMLEFETRGSLSRLNVEKFHQPFGYKIVMFSQTEKKLEAVDLVETFNYLLGITVEKSRMFKDQEREYRCVFGRQKEENFAIIWRSTVDIDLKRDKEFVEKTILDGIQPDRIFINGDSLIEKAEAIEPEFKRLMEA